MFAGIYFCDFNVVAKIAKSLTNINEFTVLTTILFHDYIYQGFGPQVLKKKILWSGSEVESIRLMPFKPDQDGCYMYI